MTDGSAAIDCAKANAETPLVFAAVAVGVIEKNPRTSAMVTEPSSTRLPALDFLGFRLFKWLVSSACIVLSVSFMVERSRNSWPSKPKQLIVAIYARETIIVLRKITIISPLAEGTLKLRLRYS
jgi:hypothetical protein